MHTTDEYEIQDQTLGWALFDVYSGIANIIIAMYLTIRFVKLYNFLDDPVYKRFQQSVIWSIASILSSILVSIGKIMLKSELLLLDPGFIVATFGCDANKCQYCVICQRITSVIALFRSCCLYLVFLGSIDTNFQMESTENNKNMLSNRCLKVTVIISQLINAIVAALFSDSKLFHLTKSDFVACYLHRNDIYISTLGVNGVVLFVMILGVTAVFFIKSRHVK